VRIVHVITTLERGGAENHLLQLVAGQVASGIDVEVAYLKDAGELADDFACLGVPVTKADGIRDLFLLMRSDKDLVHAHLPRAELTALLVAGRGNALVVSRHNAEPFWPGGPKRFSKLLSRLVDRRCKRVIVISQAVGEYMLATGHTTRADIVRTVPYGYRIPKEHKLRDQPFDSQDSTRSASRPVKLRVVARLTPQKDLPTLFKALVELKSRGHEIVLDIAGAGPDLVPLSHLVDELGLAQQVTFVGRISNPVEFIAEGDIFVLPSLYEGFGLVLLEASAARVPIVAARNTAMMEVIVDGETGLLFNTSDVTDLADKISLLIDDPEQRRHLSEAAYERLTTVYTPEAMVEKTLAVYREALAEVRR
jgi:glycosyltransferase involved in cell wall biosynthesis